MACNEASKLGIVEASMTNVEFRAQAAGCPEFILQREDVVGDPGDIV